MQSGVAKYLIIRRHLSRQSEAFTGPGTKVNVFTALAAKWAEGVALVIDAVATALWARYYFFSQIALHEKLSRTQGQFKRRILGNRMKAVICLQPHESDRHQQPVSTNFRN